MAEQQKKYRSGGNKAATSEDGRWGMVGPQSWKSYFSWRGKKLYTASGKPSIRFNINDIPMAILALSEAHESLVLANGVGGSSSGLGFSE